MKKEEQNQEIVISDGKIVRCRKVLNKNVKKFEEKIDFAAKEKKDDDEYKILYQTKNN